MKFYLICLYELSKLFRQNIYYKYQKGYNILLIFKFYNFTVANQKYKIYIRLGEIIKFV